MSIRSELGFWMRSIRRTTPWEWVTIFLIVAILGVALRPIAISDGGPSHGRLCLFNIKQTSLGLNMYANDYDGRLPDAMKWMDVIFPYTKNGNLLHDVEGVPKGGYGYGFRLRASGV